MIQELYLGWCILLTHPWFNNESNHVQSITWTFLDRINISKNTFMKPNELKVYVPLKLCFILIQKVKGSRLTYLLILLFKEGLLATADNQERSKSDKRPHKYLVKYTILSEKRTQKTFWTRQRDRKQQKTVKSQQRVVDPRIKLIWKVVSLKRKEAKAIFNLSEPGFEPGTSSVWD